MLIKEGKTNIKYLLIVVILAAVVGGGTLWCITKQEVQLIEFPEIKRPEKGEDEIANWKTYRNVELGFEFKYPNEWGIESEDKFGDEFAVNLKKSTGGSMIMIGNWVFDPGQTFEEVITDYMDEFPKKPGNEITKEEQIIVDGISAVKFSFIEGATLYPIKMYGIIVFVPVGDAMFVMEYFGDSYEDEPTFNQILSALRFLE